jgi:tRNA dimethylallyltransferase
LVKNKLIAIVGPTASGKSRLAMRLAEQFDGEIICADSRTIYRGMDIGTAKPSPADRAKVPHHMLDICEPDQAYSAAEFAAAAARIIGEIRQRGRLPLLVGGSGLSVYSVIYHYQFPAGPANAG